MFLRLSWLRKKRVLCFTVSPIFLLLAHKYVSLQISITSLPDFLIFGKAESNFKRIKADESLSTTINGTNMNLDPGIALTSQLRVLVIPAYRNDLLSPNLKHFVYDGIKQSPILTLTSDNTDCNAVWVVDIGAPLQAWNQSAVDFGFKASDNKLATSWCNVLVHIVNKTKDEIYKRAKTIKLPSFPMIYLVDNRDSFRIGVCPLLSSLVGNHNIRYTFRSLVVGRRWDKETQWVDPGHLIDPLELRNRNEWSSFMHKPISVRTDIVSEIQQALSTEKLDFCQNIVKKKRDIDVAYFWDAPPHQKNSSACFRGSLCLRDRVLHILQGLKDNWPSINFQLGIRGSMSNFGRSGVSSDYIESLLRSKIVIVTQRTAWEDHYRLFEGMVAGALVLTDLMLSLPDGLRDNKSVVQYRSESDLVGKLKYFLQNSELRATIAEAGREVAMSKHRSWHHMEKMIFGKTVSTCGSLKAYQYACPFMVHANESKTRCLKEIEKKE